MKKIFIIIFAFIFLTCREAYISPVNTPNLGYLVVEGVINSGGGNTKIALSRTTKLSDGTRAVETGATVMVQDENGNAYTLVEVARGDYEINNLNVDPNQKYRLRIVANDREYLSDFVGVNSNPAIDSVAWSRTSDGLHVSVNTHDPQQIAKYFMWDYIETWEIHSDWAPNCKFDTPNDPYWVTYIDQVKPYLRDSSKYQCWRSDTSRQILLGSTIKYAVDTISENLIDIASGAEPLSVLYSVNVRQFAFTKDAYEFMEKMKKNSEQLGSVFDAQPTELQGNIHSPSNPSEIVIGYVSICAIQEKRLFIHNEELPGWNYNSGCFLIQAVPNDRDYAVKNLYYPDRVTPFILPVEYRDRNPSDPPPSGYIINYVASDAKCVDCSLRGTRVKPAFWP
ncbi:MAG: DUF4249 domain-containing protein [Bacteroidetes bacterium]|nr:DUF4249 domain-containing protein [Bacteroidota bacterium]